MGLGNRQIRIFISSTFNDLNIERDYLINNVFKILSQRATLRDVSVIPLDLRWGITAEESRQKRVVKICLDEIKRTRPFFIGIIGERYGWCPGNSEISADIVVEEQYGWVSDAVKKNLSITEMEMLYGVLDNPTQMEAFFYIKKLDSNPRSKDDNPEEAEKRKKLEKLRMRIINNQRYPVCYFSDKEELGRLVEQHFMSMLNRLYPEPKSIEEREQTMQTSLLNSLKANYIPIPNMYKALDDFCADNDKRLFAVISPSGMGKSALLVNWLSESQNIKNMAVASYFVSNTDSSTGDIVIKRIVEQLIDKLGLPSLQQVEKPEVSLNRIMSTSETPLLIVIDGLNQISDREQQRLAWLPKPTGKTKMIVSATQGSETEEVLKIREAEILKVDSLSKAARILFLKDYLGQRAKKMNEQQVSWIVECPLCKNTLIFKTLVSQISDFGRFELLDDEIVKYVSAITEEEFYQLILASMENNYGIIAKNVLCLIAMSRNGMSEQELYGILNFRMLDWSQLYAAILPHIRVVNGLVSFIHETIRQAVISRYMSAELEKGHWREQLINYFCQLSFSYRKADELAWLYAENRNYEQLFQLLQDFRIEEYLYSKDMYELGRYWNLLINENPNKYSFESLLDATVPEYFDDYRLGYLYGNLSILSHIVLSNHDAAISMAKACIVRCRTNHGDPSQMCSFLFLLTGLCQESGKIDDAIYFCQRGLSLSLDYWGESQLSNKFQHRLGLLQGKRHEWNKAEQNYMSVLHFMEKQESVLSNEAAVVYNEMGEIYAGMNQIEKALYYMHQALKIRIRLFGEKSTWVANSYNTIGNLYETGEKLEMALDMFKKGYAIRLELLGESHPDTQSCVSNIIRVLIDANHIDEANKMLDRQLAIRMKILAPNHIQIGITYHNKGFAEYRAGQYKQALKSLLHALDIIVGNKGTKDPDAVSCLKNISLVYCEMGCYNKALDYITQSIEAGMCYYGENNGKTAELYLNRAYIFSEMDQFCKAIVDDQACLNILDRLDYQDEQLKGNAFYRCAQDYNDMQNYSQAMEYAVKAAQCRKNLLGETHDKYIDCLILIMNIYYDIDEWENCINIADSALRLLKASNRDMDEDAGRCLYQVARCCGFLGQYEKGFRYSLKNLEVRRKATPNDLLALARANYEVAYHCVKMEYFQEAEEYGKESVRINQEAGNEGLEQLSTANNLMGVLYYNQKKYEEAIPYYKQTLLWREKNLSPNHKELVSIRQNLAYALIKEGKCDEAYNLLNAVLKVQLETSPVNEKAIDRTFKNLAECVDKQDLGIQKTSQIVDRLLQRNIHSSRTARLCKRLAFNAYHKGDIQNALKYWKHEAEIREYDLLEKSEETAWALTNIGVVLRDSKCYSSALAYFKKSQSLWKGLQGGDEMTMKLALEINKIEKYLYDQQDN